MEHIKIKSRIHILKRTGWAILLVSMILAGGIRAQDTFSSRDPKVYAWWGTIYPEFCFEKAEDSGENKPVKISFWLAQAMDWLYNISTDKSRSINYFRRIRSMNIDRNAPVGVFDSGIGGLTVAREIMRNLPSEKIVYFGDTARVPYGSKSRETVIRYSRQIIHFLQEQKVKAIVVACNTASAFALDAVKDELDIPILGVIEAGAKVAAEETRNKRVGIIGTVGTVDSGIHASYLRELDPEITVIGKACPLFVPLVEEGWYHDPVTEEVARRYLKELQDQEIDTLILGCTHYPLLRSTIRKIMGEDVRLVNPAYETALELKKLLADLDLASDEAAQEEFPYRFYVSDLAEKFKDFANSILSYNVEKTQKIDIEKY